jgi:hypothetical protein
MSDDIYRYANNSSVRWCEICESLIFNNAKHEHKNSCNKTNKEKE